MIAAATLVLTAFGLLVLHGVARQAVSRAVASWTVVALLFATGLWPTLLDGSPVALVAAVTFALATTALSLGSSAVGLLSRIGAVVIWFCALALPHVLAGQVPRPTPGAVGEALFSSPKGLFFWAPVLWVGVLGLIRLTAHDRARGALASGALLVGVIAAAGSGAGGPLAGGRLHAVLPMLGLGLAHALEWLRATVERHPGIPLVAAGAALTVWNFLFMEQYRTDRIPRDLPVDLAAVSETNAAILARAVGSPTAWPANWIFSWRHRVTPAKYDIVVGQAPWPVGFVPIDDPRADPALLAEGWGSRMRCDGAPCRRVTGGARLLVPVSAGSAIPSAVRVRGPGSLSIAVNGDRPLVHVVGPTVTDLPLRAGAAGWREGVNEIALSGAKSEGAAVLGLSFAPVGGR